MNLGAILDDVQEGIDAYVIREMQRTGIPPSLMEKCIDGVQSHIRRMKADEYAQELIKAEAQQNKPVMEEKVGTVDELKEDMKKNGSVCGTKKQSTNSRTASKEGDGEISG